MEEGSLFQDCFLFFQDSMEWDSMEVQMDPEVEIFPDGARGRLQRQLWNLFEYPNSSIGAKIIGKSKLKGTGPGDLSSVPAYYRTYSIRNC
jgi:hypothetical protein